MNSVLGNYIDIVLGGTPKTTNREFWDGDIPWITPGDIGDSKHICNTERSITEAGLNSSNTKLLNIGDVVISARGSVGKLAVCDRPMVFNQSCYAIRTKNKDTLDQEYVYYLMKQCVRYLLQNAGGAVFKAIVMSTLKRTPVHIPETKQTETHRLYPLHLRRPYRKQPAADSVAGAGGAAALQRVVRPPPLPRPRTRQNQRRRARGVGEEKAERRGDFEVWESP